MFGIRNKIHEQHMQIYDAYPYNNIIEYLQCIWRTNYFR
jgi:hypothetical protein